MLIFKENTTLIDYLNKAREKHRVAFVPTMGALHIGHGALIKQAAEKYDLVVCSIYVNPTQFNSVEDLEKYPRTLETDIAFLASMPCDVLFIPDEKEIYPEGLSSKLADDLDLGMLGNVLEGAFRPGHFKGVATVVSKLLKIVSPNALFVGQKDLQQCKVIERLIEQRFPNVEQHIVETVREPDGLAYSSRNIRLTESQRAISALIYQCLVSVKTKKGMKNFEVIKKECQDILTKKGFEVEYLHLINEKFDIQDGYTANDKQFVVIAVWIGGVRLIDNLAI